MSLKLRPNRPDEKAGEEPVPEHMAAAIGALLLVPASADDHVELLGEQHVDHRRRRLGIVGQVAVGHDIDVGVDVGEHAPHDVALALLLSVRTIAPASAAISRVRSRLLLS